MVFVLHLISTPFVSVPVKVCPGQPSQGCAFTRDDSPFFFERFHPSPSIFLSPEEWLSSQKDVRLALPKPHALAMRGLITRDV
jgi:hypothetical protein